MTFITLTPQGFHSCHERFGAAIDALMHSAGFPLQTVFKLLKMNKGHKICSLMNITFKHDLSIGVVVSCLVWSDSTHGNSIIP